MKPSNGYLGIQDTEDNGGLRGTQGGQVATYLAQNQRLVTIHFNYLQPSEGHVGAQAIEGGTWQAAQYKSLLGAQRRGRGTTEGLWEARGE
jgi:hypothetical protein